MTDMAELRAGWDGSGLTARRQPSADDRRLGERAEADQGDVVDLDVAGRELADVLEDRPADGLGPAGRLGQPCEQPAVLARVVQLLAEVPGVGHAVGVDDDDVAGLERDLGLLVVRVRA